MNPFELLLATDLYPNLLKAYTDIFCLCESYARVSSDEGLISYKDAWKRILEVDAEARKAATDVSDAVVKEVNENGIFGHGGGDDE